MSDDAFSNYKHELADYEDPFASTLREMDAEESRHLGEEESLVEDKSPEPVKAHVARGGKVVGVINEDGERSDYDGDWDELPGEESLSAMDIVKAAPGDILKGIAVESLPAAASGVTEGAAHTLNFADDVADWFDFNLRFDLADIDDDGVYFETDPQPVINAKTGKADRGLSEWIPQYNYNPSTVTGGVIKGLGQFFTGWQLTRGLKTLHTGGKIAKAGVITARGAVADAAAFDPMEQRLSNFVQSNPHLENDITAYLAADADDSRAEGRLKNALEGGGLGWMAEGAFRIIRATKNAKLLKKMDEAYRDAGTQPGVVGAADEVEPTQPKSLVEGLIENPLDMPIPSKPKVTTENVFDFDVTKVENLDDYIRQYKTSLENPVKVNSPPPLFTKETLAESVSKSRAKWSEMLNSPVPPMQRPEGLTAYRDTLRSLSLHTKQALGDEAYTLGRLGLLTKMGDEEIVAIAAKNNTTPDQMLQIIDTAQERFLNKLTVTRSPSPQPSALKEAEEAWVFYQAMLTKFRGQDKQAARILDNIYDVRVRDDVGKDLVAQDAFAQRRGVKHEQEYFSALAGAFMKGGEKELAQRALKGRGGNFVDIARQGWYNHVFAPTSHQLNIIGNNGRAYMEHLTNLTESGMHAATGGRVGKPFYMTRVEAWSDYVTAQEIVAGLKDAVTGETGGRGAAGVVAKAARTGDAGDTASKFAVGDNPALTVENLKNLDIVRGVGDQLKKTRAIKYLRARGMSPGRVQDGTTTQEAANALFFLSHQSNLRGLLTTDAAYREMAVRRKLRSRAMEQLVDDAIAAGQEPDLVELTKQVELFMLNPEDRIADIFQSVTRREEVLDEAANYGREQTFTEPVPQLSQAIKALDIPLSPESYSDGLAQAKGYSNAKEARAVARTEGSTVPVGSMVAPFTGVPTRIVWEGSKFAPLVGYLTGGAAGQSLGNSTAKQLVGSLLLYQTYVAAEAGDITGNAPNESGVPRYSKRMPDGTYSSYEGTETFPVKAAMADLVRVQREAEANGVPLEGTDNIVEFYKQLGLAIKNQGWMADVIDGLYGINQYVDAETGKAAQGSWRGRDFIADRLEDLPSAVLGIFAPNSGPGNYLNKMFSDGTRPDTRPDPYAEYPAFQEALRRLEQSAMGQLLGGGKAPTKLDEWGKPVTYGYDKVGRRQETPKVDYNKAAQRFTGVFKEQIKSGDLRNLVFSKAEDYKKWVDAVGVRGEMDRLGYNFLGTPRTIGFEGAQSVKLDPAQDNERKRLRGQGILIAGDGMGLKVVAADGSVIAETPRSSFNFQPVGTGSSSEYYNLEEYLDAFVKNPGFHDFADDNDTGTSTMDRDTQVMTRTKLGAIKNAIRKFNKISTMFLRQEDEAIQESLWDAKAGIRPEERRRMQKAEGANKLEAPK